MTLPSRAEQIKRFGEDIQKWINGELELVTRRFEVPRAVELSAESVKRIREDLNMSQAEFARLIHVSKRTVEGWEHGARTPRGGEARLIDMYSKPPWRDKLRLSEPPRGGRPPTRGTAESVPVKSRTRAQTGEDRTKSRTVAAAAPKINPRSTATSRRTRNSHE